MTPQSLLDDARRGDHDAFRELVDPHRRALYTHCRRMLRSPDDAEDATQDAFVQAWTRLPGFRADSQFSTWMHRIVTNRCLDMLRARRPTATLPDRREAPASRPDRIVEAVSQVADLKRAIIRLTPEQRAPLVLRDLEGHTYEEIAETLDISVSAVKSRLHRARLELLAAMRAWE